MDRHIDMVGLLFVVYGVLLVVLGLVLLIVVAPGSSPADITAAPTSIWTALAYRSDQAGFVVLVLAVPFLVAGWGVRRRAGWARTAALVLGGLSILSFPIGTLLGGYTLWALTRPDSQTAFL